MPLHADNFFNDRNDNHVALLANRRYVVHRLVERYALYFNFLLPEDLFDGLLIGASNSRDLHSANVFGKLRDSYVFFGQPEDVLIPNDIFGNYVHVYRNGDVVGQGFVELI